jgi:predicted nucleic acid-binding protein
LALDTNVLFDLADGRDFAVTVLEVLAEETATVKISPTVMVELEYEITHAPTVQKARRAE